MSTATTRERNHMQRLLPLMSLICLIPLWELACNLLTIPDYILPAPTQILSAFNNLDVSLWLDHLWATLRVALVGFFLSLLISIPLAIAMVQSQYLTKTLYPLLVIIQSTPVVAVAPLLIVIMGTGDAPRLAITCLITFFPLVVSATTGMLSTPAELIELSRSLRVSPHKEIWQIRLPYAIPHLFSGMKVAITLAIIGAVVAEFVAAEKGLGYFIQYSTSYFEIPRAFASLFLLSAASLVLFRTVSLVQRYFFAWSLPKEERD